MLASLRPEVYNRPRFDPVQDAGDDSGGGQFTQIVFVRDPEEVKRRAEEREAAEREGRAS